MGYRILKKPEMWDDWYDQTRSKMRSIGAWDYMDPEAATPTPEPEMPPSLAEYIRANAGIIRNPKKPALTPTDSTISTPVEDEFHLVESDENEFDLEIRHQLTYEWDALNKAYGQFILTNEKAVEHLRETVPRSLHQVIDNQNTLLKKMKEIDGLMKPDPEVYARILLNRYKELQKPPNKKPVEAWLMEWENLHERVRSSGRHLTMSQNFVWAVEEFDDHGGQLLSWKRDDKGDLLDILTLIRFYRGYLRHKA